jgi:uncharacterized protein
MWQMESSGGSLNVKASCNSFRELPMRRALLAFPLSLTIFAQAPTADAKRTDIKKLLSTIEAGKLGVQAMKQVMAQQAQANPNIPESFWTEFSQEMTAEKLEEMMVPVYEKNLTHEEVKALLKFYATPEGLSFAKKQGVIQREASEAGQKLGMETAMKIMQKSGK